MKAFSLLQKPKFSKKGLIIFIMGFVLVGTYIVYRIFAASTADLMDGSIIVTTVKGVDRITPISEYSKSIEVSKKMYPSGLAPAIVVTRPSDTTGALQASLIAGAEKAPLLYSGDTISSTLKAEILRLKPIKIYVVALNSSFSATFESTLKSIYPTATYQRIGGTSRDSLAKSVGVKLVELNSGNLADGTILLVNPTSFSVETVGFYAGSKKYPVFFATTSLPTDVTTFIDTYKPTKTIVFATTSAIPDTVVASVPGKYRLTASGRPEQSIALLQHAAAAGDIDFTEIAVVSDADFAGAILSGPYMALMKKGVLVDNFRGDSAALSYLKTLSSTKGLQKIHIVADDISLSNSSMLEYANAVGSDYTSAQISLQNSLDTRIKMCPQLTGTTADYGYAQGYQAVSYYASGRIIVNPKHSSSLTTILNHEIYHVLDYRDNGTINWGESVPRSTPDCTP